MKTKNNTMKIKLQLLSFWATGSGKGGGSADGLVLKDKNNLPYISGKTFKGLVRDAYSATGGENETKLFGQKKRIKDENGYIETTEEYLNQGILRFNSLRIPSELAEKIKMFHPYLYTTKTKNSLDENKQAEKHSLRTIEMTVPITLEATIGTVDNVDTSSYFEELENACKMLRKLGEKRHRGMGRCKVTLTDNSETNSNNNKGSVKIKVSDNTIKLQCTLNNPLVLVQKDKSEQNIESLEYIPGSIIRGIIAADLFKADIDKVDDIIFNGNVHFGDGNLVIKNKRAYKAPFSFYKKQSDKNHFYNFNEITNWEEKTKQNRSGYIVFEEKEGEQELQFKKVEYGSAIKSARSEEHKSSEDGGLFVYHYLQEDQTFEFEIFSEDKGHLELIKNILSNQIYYLGKSKSAEFGGSVQFEIKESSKKDNAAKTGQFIYADSNLCFVNEYGDFSTTEIAKELTGNSSAQIDWQKSQLKTRRYAPYNWHRKNWDSERLIIEKGSVIVLKDEVKILNFKVGCFKNEGFGNILVADNNSIIPINKDCVLYNEIKPKNTNNVPKEAVETVSDDNSFVKYLKEKHNSFIEKKENEKKALELKKSNPLLKKVSTSQWARVYEATGMYFSKVRLKSELLSGKYETIDGEEKEVKKEKSICYGGSKPWDKNVAECFSKIVNDEEITIDIIRRLSKKLMKKEKTNGN